MFRTSSRKDCLLWMLAIFTAGIPCARAIFPFGGNDKDLKEAAILSSIPADMTISAQGEYIISLHQFANPQPCFKVIRLDKDGKPHPFPNLEMNNGTSAVDPLLDTVCGVQSQNEIVWMLDNGRLGEKPPRLIAWNTDTDELHDIIVITEEALLPTSDLKELVVHPDKNEPYIFISDPAYGSDAALIVVNTKTNLCRRVLQGDASVVPAHSGIFHLEGREVGVRRADGELVMPQAGVGPLATDRKGEWLYFGPVAGDILYKVRTSDLQNPALRPIDLKARVQRVGQKTYSESISLDSKGNIYLTDASNQAIGYISVKDGLLRQLVQNPQISWPGGLCFGRDEKLHFFASQLHRSLYFNGGTGVRFPIQILKIRGEASGTVGR